MKGNKGHRQVGVQYAAGSGGRRAEAERKKERGITCKRGHTQRNRTWTRIRNGGETHPYQHGETHTGKQTHQGKQTHKQTPLKFAKVRSRGQDTQRYARNDSTRVKERVKADRQNHGRIKLNKKEDDTRKSKTANKRGGGKSGKTIDSGPLVLRVWNLQRQPGGRTVIPHEQRCFEAPQN